MSSGHPSSLRLSSASKTHYFSPGEYEGRKVMVEEMLRSEGEPPCAGHVLEPMEHFGEPTGALWCPYCCGVAL